MSRHATAAASFIFYSALCLRRLMLRQCRGSAALLLCSAAFRVSVMPREAQDAARPLIAICRVTARYYTAAAALRCYIAARVIRHAADIYADARLRAAMLLLTPADFDDCCC